MSDCQTAFEEWVSGGNPYCKSLKKGRNENTYLLMSTQVSWVAFQAGWEQLNAKKNGN
jgi:hypothetical protein